MSSVMAGFASFLEQANAANNAGEVGDMGFMPFTLDVAPLQRFLVRLAQQVEQGQKERDDLRSEVQDLKLAARLALEQGLAEVTSSVTKQQEAIAALTTAQGLAHSISRHESGMYGAGADGSSAMMAEVVVLRGQMAHLESKTVDLWTVKENETGLLEAIERLKLENILVQEKAQNAETVASVAKLASEAMEEASKQTLNEMQRLQDQINGLELMAMKAQEDSHDIATNWESTTGQIWDQIRHVEASLSLRLATSETSQVSALQEVDEMKELSSELMQRVDEAKRHMGALESKLDSFNVQVAAAISPLHSSISAVNTRMAELAGTKLDISAAITEDDVMKASAMAVAHADRRSDTIQKAMAIADARMDALSTGKADQKDVVLISNMRTILDEYGSDIDSRLAAMRASLMVSFDTKASKDELGGVDGRLSARMVQLEQAILKGLKTISDKVSAALAEKLALTTFSEFKVQVRAVLADLEDRMREWSPTALATKASAGPEGGGATTCLFCDNRVKSVRDLKLLGYNADDKVFVPERLPTVEPWHNGSSTNSTPTPTPQQQPSSVKSAGARRREREGASSRLSAAALPAVPGASETLPSSSPYGVAAYAVDATSMSQLPDQGRMSVMSVAGRAPSSMDTISGAIAQGRIPNTRNQQAPRNTPTKGLGGRLPIIETPSPPPFPWPTDPSDPLYIASSLTIMGQTPNS